MKVVFPCEGSLVLMKQDLDVLKAFYNTSLLQSKMLEVYKSSDSIIQVGNFNYIPDKNYVVPYNAHFLSISKMRKILGIYNEPEKETKETTVTPSVPQKETAQKIENHNDDKISDDDLLSNPFFKTLQPLS